MILAIGFRHTQQDMTNELKWKTFHVEQFYARMMTGSPNKCLRPVTTALALESRPIESAAMNAESVPVHASSTRVFS